MSDVSGAAMTTAVDFDPFASDEPAAVYREFARLRVDAPAAYSSAYGGFWMLTRYDDVVAAASDSQRFISSVKAVVPSDPRGLRRPPLNLDAPHHTPYRRALDRTLQRGRLERLELRVREHARRSIGVMVAAGGGDLTRGYATTLPAWVTAEWLNLGAEVAPRLADAASQWVEAWRREDSDTVSRYSERMYNIARDLVADRQRDPKEVESDPASSLLQSTGPDGEPLRAEQVVACLRQCLVVGMVAPPIILGAMAVHLGRDPEIQRTLRGDRSLLPAAVEEFVRLYSPYRGFARTVSASVDMHGRRIEPGEPVTLAYAAANRDPERFESPDEFRLRRPNVHEHLGFGRGRHGCVGMPLARLTLRIALGELLDAAPSFTATESGGVRMPEVGPDTVVIAFAPPFGGADLAAVS